MVQARESPAKQKVLRSLVGGGYQFLCGYRDDALSWERGCVVLDQPQHSRIATRARIVRRLSLINELRLAEDDTAALRRRYQSSGSASWLLCASESLIQWAMAPEGGRALRTNYRGVWSAWRAASMAWGMP